MRMNLVMLKPGCELLHVRGAVGSAGSVALGAACLLLWQMGSEDLRCIWVVAFFQHVSKRSQVVPNKTRGQNLGCVVGRQLR